MITTGKVVTTFVGTFTFFEVTLHDYPLKVTKLSDKLVDWSIFVGKFVSSVVFDKLVSWLIFFGKFASSEVVLLG